MNKAKGTITMECHRLLIDASDLKPTDQFPGWPKTINYRANYERAPAAYLPEIRVQGLAHPVIQVKNAKTNELVYALRSREDFYRPPVFDKTVIYKVRVGEPDNDDMENPRKAETRCGRKENYSVSGILTLFITRPILFKLLLTSHEQVSHT